jgi:hypothetical protein
VTFDESRAIEPLPVRAGDEKAKDTIRWGV